MTPRVTALHPERGDRVSVELDGHPWRSLPATAVVRSQLTVGTVLDRSRARQLRRELRRAEAAQLAVRALARRDRSRAELAAQLERRGVGSVQRAQTLDELERARYVDDGRFAVGRAASLAARGYGDAAIVDDLEGHGLDGEQVARALEGLADEPERAAAIVARSGANVRTARRLAAKGFSEETIESALGELGPPAAGDDFV
jgi:SOS response regulatory protein OraA/RecX